MNQSSQDLAYEQTQTQQLLHNAKAELEQVEQAKPVDKARKEKLGTEIQNLEEHLENLRKLALEQQQEPSEESNS